ncbi:unnamed protein product [Vitrella brassicaformis CCMP3155]|uniref:Secretory carrier membrane protein n=2 Tax=Vitrella brassicaformis TaxID=1169539 RepID=A0A0G4EIW3_VITBC|nr:unnamed protein product [Vitrella brassicaformis CCMP3155]|mmetsp:Transcript_6080/g.14614  ORF Transcript_6080/g.14614 Transcript_6080/m.14614 type:complete len:232 (+) Transcript_6080:150-845(+)|eukprot:CEL95961.1 unnamed protein product [Vitrella brassicaformis CCMP3155]
MAAAFAAKQAISTAASSAMRGVQDEFSSASRAFGISSQPSSASTTIDWQNYNYPPFLRIVHYDLSELPSHVASIVWLINFSFILTVVICVVNFFNTIIIAAGGGSGVWVVYSILNLVLFPTAAGYTFYKGYKGLAATSPSAVRTFMWCQGILCVLYLLFSILPAGAFNGWARFSWFKHYNMSKGMKNYWVFVIIVESILYTANFIIAGVNLLKVHNFNPYHSAQAMSGGFV